MKFRSMTCLAIVCQLLMSPSHSVHAANQEIIIDGDFERAMPNIEIYRYPVFLKSDSAETSIRRVTGTVANGYSLLMPRHHKGGYKLVLPVVMMKRGDNLELKAKLYSSVPVNANLEVFSERKRLYQEKTRVSEQDRTLSFSLNGLVNSDAPRPVSLVLWLSAGANFNLDDLSLTSSAAPAQASVPAGNIQLSSDQVFGVYGINENGRMLLTGNTSKHDFGYRIVEQISDELVVQGELAKANSKPVIPLYTGQRGSYRVEIYEKGQADPASWRLYAVINKQSEDNRKDNRYGMAMEEYGQRQLINATLDAENWYQLASWIGVGNVRLFTAAMPDLLSKNGSDFDFSASGAMLDLSSKYDMEPLVELGTNLPNRLPDWLRTDDPQDGDFDIREGIRTNNLKAKFKRHADRPWFDSSAYEAYLEKVFSAFAGRATYFEIWNEPGHKFSVDDFTAVSRLTRSVQKRLAPDAKLVGYTSSKGAGVGKGKDPDRLPEFTRQMVNACPECIDILSYHSEHAFIFMGKHHDWRDDETGYVSRLRIVKSSKPGLREMPIWDTERGIIWDSPHDQRIDHISGTRRTGKLGFRHIVSVNEVARRLPAVHAAAWSNGVEKLFWFYMNSGTMSLARNSGRYGFFDAYLEPMPHLPVYDAMTEIIGDTALESFEDRDDGTRIYRFQDDASKSMVIMVFNWKQDKTIAEFDVSNASVKVLDIFGNPVDSVQTTDGKLTLPVDGWVRYVLINKAGQP